MSRTFLITGAAGFIGTNFVKMLLKDMPEARIVVVDALTYCGNIANISEEIAEGKISFLRGDITDRQFVENAVASYEPDYIINFAAETHVDRSLSDSRPFVNTNVGGTLNLLDTARKLGSKLLKYVQISTDEVYGDLDADIPEGRQLDEATATLLGRQSICYGTDSFSETSPIKPSSPYSASKASADLLTMAYHHSFGLPAVVTRCSNNYGPYQHPEKLIPLMINNMLSHNKLPVYGQGLNVRDWIHAEDHARGVLAAALTGIPGRVYNFGGYNERRNIDLVRQLIAIVFEITEDPAIDETLIEYVGDRPGHDRRYAIDATRSMTELGWRPVIPFGDGLRDTARWYISNRQWLDGIVSGEYRSYYDKMYSNRQI